MPLETHKMTKRYDFVTAGQRAMPTWADLSHLSDWMTAYAQRQSTMTAHIVHGVGRDGEVRQAFAAFVIVYQMDDGLNGRGQSQ